MILKKWKKGTWAALLGMVILLLIGWRMAASVPKVDTVFPRKQTVVDLVVATGTIRSARQSALGTETYGQVREVWVQEGAVVRSGQKLVELESTLVRQRLEQAKWAAEGVRKEWERLRRGPQKEEIQRARAELDRAAAARLQAEQDFERMQRLFEDRLIPQADLERSKANFDQAKAVEGSWRSNLELLLRQPLVEDLEILGARLKEKEAAVRLAETEMQKTVLKAPYTGLVVKRHVEPGQSVVPGTALITLADLDQMEVVVETDENNLAKLRPGQEAVVAAPAFKERAFRARLIRIGPEVDPARGVIALRFRPLTVPEYIRPDMTVDVNIETGRFPETCTVPVTALLEEKGKSFVHILKGGRVARREVRVLTKGPEWAALADFDPTVQVVVKGTEVKEGQKIRARSRSRNISRESLP